MPSYESAPLLTLRALVPNDTQAPIPDLPAPNTGLADSLGCDLDVFLGCKIITRNRRYRMLTSKGYVNAMSGSEAPCNQRLNFAGSSILAADARVRMSVFRMDVRRRR
jgi:hypothetical protein